MRRPRFKRWIRSEVLRIADTSSFSLRKFAAKAQREDDARFRAALLLHAHENAQIDRLFSYIYDESVLAEYRNVESRLGQRSIERLALRGTPMMSLPKTYRDLLAEYENNYYAPERLDAEKRILRDSSFHTMLRYGISPTDVAKSLELDVSNVNAYLSRGDVGRFTVETARAIDSFIEEESHRLELMQD